MYTYDNRGNILSSSEYTYTTVEDLTSLTPTKTDSYTYSSNEEWKDKLLALNGNPITYDESGNPLTYNGYTYTWDMGRQLKSISNGTNTYSYTYNEEGIRTSKTVNGVTTNYVIDNKLIKAEYTDTYSIVYWYDDTDSIIGFFYTDKTTPTHITSAYIYTKNAQGDVTGILNSSGTQVVNYTYDSWGNVLSITGSLSITIGSINPMRYRGYYLDNETGYYYLQSRYYIPEWHRFINADDSGFIGATGTLLSKNAFIYCENLPVKNYDIKGNFPAKIVGAIAGAIVSFILDLLSQTLSNFVINKKIGNINWWSIGFSAVSGAISGLISISKAYRYIQIITSVTVAIANNLFSYITSKSRSGSALFFSIIVDVTIAIIIAAKGGHGIARKYIRKGGYINPKKNGISKVFKMSKSVMKDLVKSYWKSIWTSFVGVYLKITKALW